MSHILAHFVQCFGDHDRRCFVEVATTLWYGTSVARNLVRSFGTGGNEDYGLTNKVFTNPVSLIKICWGHLMHWSSRVVCGRTSPLLSTCAILLHRCYKGEIRQCGWPFLSKSKLPYPLRGWPHVIPCRTLRICIGVAFLPVNRPYYNFVVP